MQILLDSNEQNLLNPKKQGFTPTKAMNQFRSWSRRAWVLHGYLITTLALLPLQPVNSTWTDGDADGANDTWTSSDGSTYSVSQLDANDLDIDHDGAYNNEELTAGSDPFKYDTDDDGLNDGDEIHVANQQNGLGYSLTNWDSNGDGVSDHDDFYGCFSVTYAGGVLPAFSGASYFDYDGDGTKNPFDLYPADPANNDADADGIDDNVDPALGDPYNTSSANGQQWGSGALGDDDADSILNFYDQWPSDSSNGNSDSDGDTFDNSLDPFPSDNSNYSSVNGIYWYGDIFGDSDSDGVSNYNDSWPYDSNNGTGGTSNDDDGDGITNDIDPAVSDYDNNSPYNNTAWSWYPLEDADNDGQSNFYDAFPYDQYDNQPDFDGDGWPNESDPFPRDNSNYSELNSTAWQTTLFEDPDVDGLANWQDPYPTDPYNGDPDYDDDTIANESDPFPTDGANYSEINQTSWGGGVLGDDDIDGILNWQDPTPSGDGPSSSDSDGDMIDDSIDPAPSDQNNYSTHNWQSWYADVFGDEDGDGTLNFWDQWIGDPYNGFPPNYDFDADGINDDIDPSTGDSSNYSWYNSTSWYSDALNDADHDGTANFYDYQPYGDSNVDSDGDGLYDSNDPAPSDPYNISYVNSTWWYGNALGDDDGDGLVNFDDPFPSGPPVIDSDLDGLNEGEESGWGTSDSDSDSDDDGLEDGDEVNIYGTSPTNPYSRSQYFGWGDLYMDIDLVDLSDSDADEIPDLVEQHYGLNPNWRGDALLDRDNDGVNNITQFNAGVALDAHLDDYDADDDGMTDVFEDAYAQVLSKNDAADAVLDADSDGVLNYEEQVLLISPMNADTLQQGGLGDLQWLMLNVRYPDGSSPPVDDVAPANEIPDWADAVVATPSAPDFYHFTRVPTSIPGEPADLDGDGMPDAWEHQYGRWKFQVNGLQLRFDDAEDDADEDGLTNLFEYGIGTSPLAGDSDGDAVEDEDEDFDGDGLTNAQEINLGTNAANSDSDGDGDSDGQEVAAGTDPKDGNSSLSSLVGLRVFTPLGIP